MARVERNRPAVREVVITGMGVVSPIGVSTEAYAAALRAGRSGVGPLTLFNADSLPVHFGGEVREFDAKNYVRQRKSLKVMSRDIQFAYAAAIMAAQQAAIEGNVNPERLGVVFGADLIYGELEEVIGVFRRCIVDGHFESQRWDREALGEMFPLWMLKYLPNMLACHIGIAVDARGPNNSITHGEVSSLLAVTEGTHVIQRNAADAVIVGGGSSRLHVTPILFRGEKQLSHRNDDPAGASRPFDLARDGSVNAEGAAAFVLESRQHAEERGAPILARVLACHATFEPRSKGFSAPGQAIRAALAGAIEQAGLRPDEIGHVNAHGASTVSQDQSEAQAIRDVLGDVPVTAPKSFFGNAGAGAGAIEMVASVLALQSGAIPATLNYSQPDPECPVNVVHGGPLASKHHTAIVTNHTTTGQAVAVVLAAP